MATDPGVPTEGSGEVSTTWIDPNARLPRAGSSSDTRDESTSDDIDLEFEWYQLCHGCGERKWFRALICEACRQRHGL
ncbi:hypothetical protein [Natronorubrum aibiense]|uniref:Uncharacterized protein n=1 Tax=Natronorubrum aibiense TaxID=348826 RepID=A0A5P9P173_9EURY|nr:hypothetical protein [Natronorubrum aibiense]QFU81872.1 hypothetical protein GCU68_04625 [Natronorubrum aibiense]